MINEIMALSKRERELEQERQELGDEIDHKLNNSWTACIHAHYQNPIVSLWPKGEEPSEQSNLTIRLSCDGWQFESLGNHADKAEELKKLLDEIFLEGK